jgi:hypothetical protein
MTFSSMSLSLFFAVFYRVPLFLWRAKIPGKTSLRDRLGEAISKGSRQSVSSFLPENHSLSFRFTVHRKHSLTVVLLTRERGLKLEFPVIFRFFTDIVHCFFIVTLISSAEFGWAL